MMESRTAVLFILLVLFAPTEAEATGFMTKKQKRELGPHGNGIGSKKEVINFDKSPESDITIEEVEEGTDRSDGDISIAQVTLPEDTELLLSDAPSLVPSDMPSLMPSDIPSDMPSLIPSEIPSQVPSDAPSLLPTEIYVTTSPTTAMPVSSPPTGGLDETASGAAAAGSVEFASVFGVALASVIGISFL